MLGIIIIMVDQLAILILSTLDKEARYLQFYFLIFSTPVERTRCGNWTLEWAFPQNGITACVLSQDANLGIAMCKVSGKSQDIKATWTEEHLDKTA